MSDGWSPRNEAVGGLGGGLYYAPGPFRTPSTLRTSTTASVGPPEPLP